MENNRKTIYLSGPIMDEHAGTARAWRETAKQLLGGRFRLLDPMRRAFVDRDADIILVNYNKASIGTSMEVFYAAHDLGRFVVAFSPFEYKDCSPWMARYCTKILGSLEEAAEYVNNHFTEQQV